MVQDTILEDKIIKSVFTDASDLANLIEDSVESTIDTTMMPVAVSYTHLTLPTTPYV